MLALDSVMLALDSIGSTWAIRIMRWLAILALVAFRRG